MYKSRREIRIEIDATLDRLLENEKVLQEVGRLTDYQSECMALKKMQESLIAHLMHMDELLHKKEVISARHKPIPTKAIAKKLSRCEYLKPKRRPKPKIHRRSTLVRR